MTTACYRISVLQEWSLKTRVVLTFALIGVVAIESALSFLLCRFLIQVKPTHPVFSWRHLQSLLKRHIRSVLSMSKLRYLSSQVDSSQFGVICCVYSRVTSDLYCQCQSPFRSLPINNVRSVKSGGSLTIWRHLLSLLKSHVRTVLSMSKSLLINNALSVKSGGFLTILSAE